MELKERIAKALYEQYIEQKSGMSIELFPWEKTWKSSYYLQAEAILPIVEAEVKAERKRMLKKIWKIGEGVDTEAVIEEVNTWCCEIEF